MRILMLGNSFTYYHDMPAMLAALTGWEVVSHTRGGAHLCEHLDPDSELGQKTLPALLNEKWDVVVLQDHSREPIARKEQFMRSMNALCARIHEADAVPLLYATWAYRDGSALLAETGLSYAGMADALYEAYHKAGDENGAPVADVGRAFAALHEPLELYDPDSLHPSPAGSLLAAMTIAGRIRDLFRPEPSEIIRRNAV